MLNINPRLERYIFDELGAVYQINPENVAHNLANDEEDNLNYLGTYFPRSFVEAYNIYTNLFNNEFINRAFQKKEIINILDIGSGTGGNLIGLLQVLNNTYRNKHIYIYSIDGNDIALGYLSGFIKKFYKFMDYNENRIRMKAIKYQFTNKNDIKNTVDRMKQADSFDRFDIIHTFKFANELYTKNFFLNQGTYREILNVGEDYLAPDGIMVIEDITNKIVSQYIPIIMSNECREYFKQNIDSKIRFILPLSCAFWHENCNSHNCFSKREFTICHRYNANDVSKVTYKVFATTELAEEILSNINNCHRYYYTISQNNTNGLYNFCRCGNFLYGQEYPSEREPINSFIL